MTGLKLKHPKYLVPYLLYTAKIIKQIIKSDGFIKGKILAEPNLSMWTTTLWRSKEASNAFYCQGNHRSSMSLLKNWASEAVTGFKENHNSNQLPSWKSIAYQLMETGNFNLLAIGSYNHQNKIIPPAKFTFLTIPFH